MIELVTRLAAADAIAAAEPLADNRARELLGWPRVLGQVARHCHNARAADQVRAQLPHRDPEIIAVVRALADELRPFADRDDWPPLGEVSTAADLLDAPSPRRLEGPDLLLIAALIADIGTLRDWCLRREEDLPSWTRAVREIPDLSAVAGELRRCLDADGSVADRASPLLARLRRTAREREQQVRDSVARAMSEASRRGWTTGDEVTLRGDRFCLPLKSGDRRKVDGIVHDRSHTGQTVYVEPAATVHLANDLTEARLAMAAEETRILLALNQRVDAVAPALAAAIDLVLLVDRVRAAMRWSDEFGARRPELAGGAAPRLCRARHPLLIEALGEAVVPLDLELPPDARALVISGPNAGGKTVAMKTLGVLVMLAQCGWDVPAREDTRLPLVAQMMVDIGDEQSIEDSLSSFSAHLTHLQRFLAQAGPGTLLLCDEIGSGTDPQEGTALAFTVLEQLIARGALVVASTHYGLLKAAVHDHPAMINAAMDYDEASLAPLFTLRLGDPGASHAFDIAARVGLDADLLARARTLVGEERYQLEQLLRDLAQRSSELQRREQAAAELEASSRRHQDELQRRLKGLDKELERERRERRREGEALVRQWRRKLEHAVREVRSEGASRTVVQQARRELESIARELPETAPEAAGAPADLVCGDRVRVPHLGLTGQVTEVRGEKIGVVADGLRVSVDRAAVERTDTAPPPPTMPTETAGAWTWDQDDVGIPPELDLRGLHAEEAWQRLDRMLDRAVPVGLDQLTVVHGMGTGRLREQLLARLSGDRRVRDFHPGGERQNNFGATVIHLL